jgi:hemerythrin superfamily protein
MKKALIVSLLLTIFTLAFARNKDVVYNKDTGEILGVATQITNSRDSDRVNIKMENDVIIYGAKTDKITTASVDEKSISADVMTGAYKIDTKTKEIFQEVILEEEK